MAVSLIPDVLLPSYRHVTPDLLRQAGIRLLLCDLDYTLSPRCVPQPDEALRRWIGQLEASGVQVMILSNNRSSRRVERFCGDLGIPYVGHAQKPLRRGYRRAMALAGTAPGETAMLGDKLLTDVLGARLSGVTALMVEPAGGAVTLGQKVLHALQAPFKYICKRRSRP